MIEIIYDKDKESKKETIEESGSETSTYKENVDKHSGESGEGIRESAVSLGGRLPKNIRQIGTPAGNKRIYIEDYVVTYLNYIARPGSTHARGAILLGECKHSEVGDIIFISGAVDAQNIEFDMDESEFTQEAWTDIYDQVKEFFPDLSVVGWFLSRMGFSTAINDKIEKMHVDNFPGKNMVLYISDSLESDDAFYMYERGQLVKQRGYFIYYTKNEPMQSYIIKQRGGVTEESDTEIKRKDEEVIRNYRQKNSRTQGSKQGGISLLYVASSFVVLAILAMGITVISNLDKMREMEISINRLELTAQDATTEDYRETMATEESSTDGTTASEIAEPTSEDASEQTTENVANATEENVGAGTEQGNETTEAGNSGGSITPVEDGGEETISTEQTLPAMSDGNPTYYLVKYGDTLSSIAYEQYGSIKYADDIAAANDMNVNDKIYDGQEIILPAVEKR